MGKALDAMEEAFEAIIDNGELILDEDFMMNIFSELTEKIDPFKDYMEYMFEDKLSSIDAVEEKVMPWDLLRAAVFYSSRADIVQTDEQCPALGMVLATRFLIEFRDTSKVTSGYLSSIAGKHSLAVISEEQRKAGFGKEASNSISESNFASATHSLKVYGTIRLDSAAAEGLARTNHAFDRGHEQFINTKSKKDSTNNEGLLFSLPSELVISLFHSAKAGAPKLRKRHDNALDLLNKAKLNKLRSQQLKVTEKTEEKLIIAMDYFDRGCSERRWTTQKQAKDEYDQIPSESSRLAAVKEQILIYKLGFGWTDCGHKWSENGKHFTSKELLNHLIGIVIPLAIQRGIPSESPVDIPSGLMNDYKLGTKTSLDYSHECFNVKSVEDMKRDAELERQRREDNQLTDRDYNRQPVVMPVLDDSLIGFPIEYLFEYLDDDGSPFAAWCDGVVESIHNKKTRMVVIKWNEKKVAPGDVLTSRHKLGLRKWNPKSPSPGAWRKFVGNPDA
jgi:hypothetical protein